MNKNISDREDNLVDGSVSCW